METVASIARRVAVALCALSLVASIIMQPAMAEHVIPVLGTQPVLGRMNSTADLQREVRDHRSDFETALQAIGLTEWQTHELERRIANRELSYVLIPRHLEAMTGKEGGRIFLERDVIIPANTYGWAIDIPDGSQIITIYLPAVCGNPSLIHRSAPPPPSPKPHCPQNMLGTPPNCYYPTCPQGMTGTPPNCYPPPTPSPTPESTPPPPVEQHKTSWLLFPLILIGGYVIGHNNTPPPPPRCDP